MVRGDSSSKVKPERDESPVEASDRNLDLDLDLLDPEDVSALRLMKVCILNGTKLIGTP
jgi:hypothetical protein